MKIKFEISIYIPFYKIEVFENNFYSFLIIIAFITRLLFSQGNVAVKSFKNYFNLNFLKFKIRSLTSKGIIKVFKIVSERMAFQNKGE